MKKIILPFRVIIVIIVFIIGITYVSKLKSNIPHINEIKSVEVHIGGADKEENYTFYLSEKENILEVININKQLLKYKDPDVDTWKLDVSITYSLENGMKQKEKFKKIRPVSDYFEKIYNSLEYKKQTIDIFKIKPENITKIILKDSYIDRKKTITIEDKDIILKAYKNSMKTFELYNSDEEYYYIGNIEFYNSVDNNIAHGIILREHLLWNNFFNENEIVSPIKVSPSEIEEIIIRNDKISKKILIKDYDKMSEILDTYYDGHHGTKSSNYSVEIVLKNPDMRHWYGSFYKSKVPRFIVNSF